MENEDLKPRQYKRIGRIAENNPQRAERVAERMTTKAERATKGKEIADKYSSSKQRPQAPLERLKSDKMPNSQYENLKNELKTTSYDSINFKNKDIDKFKGRFGQDGVRDMGKTLSLDEIEAIRKPKP
jgi:hypothetical protein